MERTFAVECIRKGRWWGMTVRELPGVYARARRLDQADEIARETIASYLDLSVESVTVTLELRLPERLAKDLEEMQELRRRANAAGKDARGATLRVVSQLRDTGLTVRDMGRVLGVSFQRAAQLDAAARDLRRVVEEVRKDPTIELDQVLGQGARDARGADPVTFTEQLQHLEDLGRQLVRQLRLIPADLDDSESKQLAVVLANLRFHLERVG